MKERMSAKAAKKEIMDCIRNLSGAKSPYEVFYDWVTSMAMMYANLKGNFLGPEHLSENERKIYEDREDLYEKATKGYPDEAAAFSEMLGYLILAMEDEPSDILGEVFMESGLGNKDAGQFFTPFHVSLVTARLNVAKIDPGEKLHILEPSCGSGGMIIATALALREKGVNYQLMMDAVAQDLDWRAVYMAYVQLSILGIKAVVVQGDTLAEPYAQRVYRHTPREFVTPAKEGLLCY